MSKFTRIEIGVSTEKIVDCDPVLLRWADLDTAFALVNDKLSMEKSAGEVFRSGNSNASFR